MADAVPPPAKLIPPAGSNADSPLGPKPTVDRRLPFLLDFYPLQDSKQTRLSPFFDALKSGRLTTTQCPSGHLTWPPRVVCPHCHSEALTWVDLPHHGRIYAFSAVLAGPPMGIESELPFVVGLVDLDGSSAAPVRTDRRDSVERVPDRPGRRGGDLRALGRTSVLPVPPDLGPREAAPSDPTAGEPKSIYTAPRSRAPPIQGSRPNGIVGTGVVA